MIVAVRKLGVLTPFKVATLRVMSRVSQRITDLLEAHHGERDGYVGEAHHGERDGYRLGRDGSVEECDRRGGIAWMPS